MSGVGLEDRNEAAEAAESKPVAITSVVDEDDEIDEASSDGQQKQQEQQQQEQHEQQKKRKQRWHPQAPGRDLANSKIQRPNGGRPPKRRAPGRDLASSKEAAVAKLQGEPLPKQCRKRKRDKDGPDSGAKQLEAAVEELALVAVKDFREVAYVY